MARNKITFLAVLVVGLLLATNASAATLQGLEWGIEDGDQFNYTIDITALDPDDASLNGEVIYMEITSVATIPNIVDDLGDIPTPNLDITWANGTSMGWNIFILLPSILVTPTFAVPIGNYTLLTEVYEADVFYNGTVTDSGGFWGVEDTIINDITNETFTVLADYLKSDGMLAHYSFIYSNETTQLSDFQIERNGLPSLVDDILNSPYLLIGMGAVIVLLLVVVICKKK